MCVQSPTMNQRFLISPADGAVYRNAFQDFSAQYWRHGYFVQEDWRYEAMYRFVHASPSFRAVLAQVRGKTTELPLPKDLERVREVVEDFYLPIGAKTPMTNDSIARMEKLRGFPKNEEGRIAHSNDWWDAKGRRLFGLAAPDPSVRVFPALTESHKSIRVERFKNDSVVAQISLGQTIEEALEQLKSALLRFNFSRDNIQVEKPKYKLHDHPIRRSTAAMALTVLEQYYRPEIHNPLWLIGNECAVTKSISFTAEQYEKFKPEELAYRKRRLEIATSRVLRTALLLAENAARGRFPCVEPFEEAQLKAIKRKAGRPVGSSTRKKKQPLSAPDAGSASPDFSRLSSAFGLSVPHNDQSGGTKLKKR